MMASPLWLAAAYTQALLGDRRDRPNPARQHACTPARLVFVLCDLFNSGFLCKTWRLALVAKSHSVKIRSRHGLHIARSVRVHSFNRTSTSHTAHSTQQSRCRISGCPGVQVRMYRMLNRGLCFGMV